ncbi:MAG: prolyl aminopeptidase [Caulobacterales bacterium]
MVQLYPPIEPYEQGVMAVGNGHQVYWEECGNPKGKPALVIHGGPGSGATPGWRRYFDPSRYRVVLFDQRGCGRSIPNAADALAALEANTTSDLIADIERLRQVRQIERWLLFGGSWGVTLGLAYAQAHPDRVSEAIFFSITAGGDGAPITQEAGRLFPEAWEQFRRGVPAVDRDGDLADAYARLLANDDPAIREKAAYDWCAWEAAHVAVRPDQKPPARYQDRRFRMMFARIVTHYWRNKCWLDGVDLIGGASKLANIPAKLFHGRLDVSGPPPEVATELSRMWRGSKLTILDDAGHGAGEPSMTERLVEATDAFAV